MTCENAQGMIMLHHEKRLKPGKAVALFKHIDKCDYCREFFMLMEEPVEAEAVEVPELFTQAVMDKIHALPEIYAAKKEAPEPKKKIEISRLIIGVYGLILSAGLAVLFYTELIEISDTAPIWSGLWDLTAQNITAAVLFVQAAASNVSAQTEVFGNIALGIAVALVISLFYFIKKEKIITNE